MKNHVKKLLSLCLAVSFVAGLSLTSAVSADPVENSASLSSAENSSNVNELTKVPDAFNPELKKQKLNELRIKNAETRSDGDERIYVAPNRPVVLTFDDGSAITYSSNIEVSPLGLRQLIVNESYSYLVGYAKVQSIADNVTTSTWTGGGAQSFWLSQDSADLYSKIVDTGFAEVTLGITRGKQVQKNSTTNIIRVESRGSIKYVISGVTKMQDYDIIWEADPNNKSGEPYIVPSY